MILRCRLIHFSSVGDSVTLSSLSPIVGLTPTCYLKNHQIKLSFIFSPGFVVNPVSTVGIYDRNITLTCVARADSQPSSMKWFKDDQEYTSGVTAPSYNR
jgi:hypothetical protein